MEKREFLNIWRFGYKVTQTWSCPICRFMLNWINRNHLLQSKGSCESCNSHPMSWNHDLYWEPGIWIRQPKEFILAKEGGKNFRLKKRKRSLSKCWGSANWWKVYWTHEFIWNKEFKLPVYSKIWQVHLLRVVLTWLHENFCLKWYLISLSMGFICETIHLISWCLRFDQAKKGLCGKVATFEGVDDLVDEPSYR